jgi:hypothetical protein
MNVRVLAVTALMLVGATFPASHAAVTADSSTPITCHVTQPQGGIFGNDSLAAVLPYDGKFIFKPNGPGFLDQDGGLGIKVGWELRKKGSLSVTGRRLDGVAAPVRAYIHRTYDDYLGGMSIFLIFPTPGCWEITGSVADGTLKFVVQVEKIGDGPSGHLEAPSREWRVTTGRSERQSDNVPVL